MGAYEGWAVLELMGHRRLAGFVSEVTLAGAQVLRIDVPGKTPSDPPRATQYYAGSALFCLTPTTEEAARSEANPPDWGTREPALLGAARSQDDHEPDEEDGP